MVHGHSGEAFRDAINTAVPPELKTRLEQALQRQKAQQLQAQQPKSKVAAKKKK